MNLNKIIGWALILMLCFIAIAYFVFIIQEDRVLAAKLRYPLLVARWMGKWTVVDGIHRLERYRRRGITIIPVKEVTQDMLKHTRIK